MTIKLVTLTKVCEHRVAHEELENGRAGWVRLSRRLVLGLFSLGMYPHNSKAGLFFVGPHPGGWACGPAGDWMCKVRLMFTSRNKEKWSL